jgi:hypothetical protein
MAIQTQSRNVAESAVDLGEVQAGLLGGNFDAPGVASPDIPAQLAAQGAQLHVLRAEVERLRAERDRLADRQREIAQLLKSANPDKIVHDLRNLLNEVQLYKMLADVQGS